MKHCGLKFRRSLDIVYPDRLLHPSGTERQWETVRDRDKELQSERATDKWAWRHEHRNTFSSASLCFLPLTLCREKDRVRKRDTNRARIEWEREERVSSSLSEPNTEFYPDVNTKSTVSFLFKKKKNNKKTATTKKNDREHGKQQTNK